MFGFGPGELILILLFFAIPAVLVVLPAWRIAERAGFHGAWSLLMLVPLVNLAVVFAFAFLPWPLEERARSSALPEERTAPTV
jgi:hypothetical protein